MSKHVFTRCCRLCLHDGSNHELVDVFSVAGLSDKIAAVYEISITANDNLPSQVCIQCFNEILHFLKLRRLYDEEKRRFVSNQSILGSRNGMEQDQLTVGPNTSSSKGSVASCPSGTGGCDGASLSESHRNRDRKKLSKVRDKPKPPNHTDAHGGVKKTPGKAIEEGTTGPQTAKQNSNSSTKRVRFSLHEDNHQDKDDLEPVLKQAKYCEDGNESNASANTTVHKQHSSRPKVAEQQKKSNSNPKVAKSSKQAVPDGTNHPEQAVPDATVNSKTVISSDPGLVMIVKVNESSKKSSKKSKKQKDKSLKNKRKSSNGSILGPSETKERPSICSRATEAARATGDGAAKSSGAIASTIAPPTTIEKGRPTNRTEASDMRPAVIVQPRPACELPKKVSQPTQEATGGGAVVRPHPQNNSLNRAGTTVTNDGALTLASGAAAATGFTSAQIESIRLIRFLPPQVANLPVFVINRDLPLSNATGSTHHNTMGGQVTSSTAAVPCIASGSLAPATATINISTCSTVSSLAASTVVANGSEQRAAPKEGPRHLKTYGPSPSNQGITPRKGTTKSTTNSAATPSAISSTAVPSASASVARDATAAEAPQKSTPSSAAKVATSSTTSPGIKKRRHSTFIRVSTNLFDEPQETAQFASLRNNLLLRHVEANGPPLAVTTTPNNTAAARVTTASASSFTAAPATSFTVVGSRPPPAGGVVPYVNPQRQPAPNSSASSGTHRPLASNVGIRTASTSTAPPGLSAPRLPSTTVAVSAAPQKQHNPPNGAVGNRPFRMNIVPPTIGHPTTVQPPPYALATATLMRDPLCLVGHNPTASAKPSQPVPTVNRGGTVMSTAPPSTSTSASGGGVSVTGPSDRTQQNGNMRIQVGPWNQGNASDNAQQNHAILMCQLCGEFFLSEPLVKLHLSQTHFLHGGQQAELMYATVYDNSIWKLLMARSRRKSIATAGDFIRQN